MLEKRKNTVTIFFDYKGKLAKLEDIPINKNLLEVAHENDINLEGACEGSLACSTCHVICDPSLFNKDGDFEYEKNKFEEIQMKENDLLDKAYGVTENSRLGCQIKLNKNMNNKVFKIPKDSVNFAVDGHVSKHH